MRHASAPKLVIAVLLGIGSVAAGCKATTPTLTGSASGQVNTFSNTADSMQDLPHEVVLALKKQEHFHLLAWDPCSSSQVPDPPDGQRIYSATDRSTHECFSGYFDDATSHGDPVYLGYGGGSQWYCGGPQSGPDVYSSSFAGCPGYIGPVVASGPTPTPSPKLSIDCGEEFSPDGDDNNDMLSMNISVDSILGAWTLQTIGTTDPFQAGSIATGSSSTTAPFKWDSTIRKGTGEELALPDGLYTLQLSAGGQSVTKDVLISRTEFDDDELFDSDGEFISEGDLIAGKLDAIKLEVKLAIIAAREAKAAYLEAKTALVAARQAWKAGQIADAEYARLSARVKQLQDARNKAIAARTAALKKFEVQRASIISQAHDSVPPPSTADISNFNFISQRGLIKAKPKQPVPGVPGKLRMRWKSSSNEIWEWDYQHGEFEVFDASGKNHLGAWNMLNRNIKGGEAGRTTKPL